MKFILFWRKKDAKTFVAGTIHCDWLYIDDIDWGHTPRYTDGLEVWTEHWIFECTFYSHKCELCDRIGCGRYSDTVDAVWSDCCFNFDSNRRTWIYQHWCVLFHYIAKKNRTERAWSNDGECQCITAWWNCKICQKNCGRNSHRRGRWSIALDDSLYSGIWCFKGNMVWNFSLRIRFLQWWI